MVTISVIFSLFLYFFKSVSGIVVVFGSAGNTKGSGSGIIYQAEVAAVVSIF